jgi:hypothetical protein
MMSAAEMSEALHASFSMLIALYKYRANDQLKHTGVPSSPRIPKFTSRMIDCIMPEDGGN